MLVISGEKREVVTPLDRYSILNLTQAEAGTLMTVLQAIEPAPGLTTSMAVVWNIRSRLGLQGCPNNPETTITGTLTVGDRGGASRGEDRVDGGRPGESTRTSRQ